MSRSRSTRPAGDSYATKKSSHTSYASSKSSRADNSVYQHKLAAKKKMGGFSDDDLAWIGAASDHSNSSVYQDDMDFSGIRKSVDPNYIYTDEEWARAKNDPDLYEAKVEYVMEQGGAHTDAYYGKGAVDLDFKKKGDPGYSWGVRAGIPEYLKSIRATVDPNYIYDDAEWARTFDDDGLYNAKYDYVKSQSGEASFDYKDKIVDDYDFKKAAPGGLDPYLRVIRDAVDPGFVYGDEEWARTMNDPELYDIKVHYVRSLQGEPAYDFKEKMVEDDNFKKAAPTDLNERMTMGPIRRYVDPDYVYTDEQWAYAKTDPDVYDAKVEYLMYSSKQSSYDYKSKYAGEYGAKGKWTK